MIPTLLGLMGAFTLLFGAVAGEFTLGLLGLGLCVICALWRGFDDRGRTP